MEIKENLTQVHTVERSNHCLLYKSHNTKNNSIKRWIETHGSSTSSSSKTSSDFTNSNINQDKNIKCVLCLKTFSTVESLRTHQTHHLPQNNDGYFQCTVCCKVYDKLYGIFKHYKALHAAVKFIKCTHCEHKFNHLLLLRKHTSKHTEFKSSEKSAAQATTQKNDIKVHMCNVCKAKYSTIRLLHQHQKEHERDVSLRCQKCKKNFANKDQVLIHKMKCKKKELKFICEICEQKFSCISQKACHMKSVHF